MRFHFHHSHREEKGVALLLALFALILISAVGVAIVFMSTGETSIVSNERSYATVWEAAKGGLEEARSRISGADPHTFGASLPADATHILYIINPASAAEVVAPNVAANAYFDSEYNTEWGQPITTAGLTVTTVNSDMVALRTGGTLTTVPMYKWVRVTVKTEKSSQEDVNQDGTFNTVIPISYDGNAGRQTLVASPAASTMVYRVTSLAVLPNGTTRMLQYDLKPGVPIPPVPGALTVCGPTVNATGWPSSANWIANGNDSGVPAQAAVPAVADCSAASETTLEATSAGLKNPPTGISCPPAPDSICNTAGGAMNSCWNTYSCLTSMAASIASQATDVNSGGCPGGTAAAPVITFDDATHPFSCSGGGAGYGILIVEDGATFGGNYTFNGLILILGTGNFSYKGTNTFNGAIYLANTSAGNMGQPTINGNGGGVGSINYDSQDISMLNNLFPYNALAAREISQ